MDLFKLFTFRKVLATLILLLGTYELTAIAATLNQVSRLSTLITTSLQITDLLSPLLK